MNIWRLQFGPMMHHGLLPSGRIKHQMARVGTGRLSPIHLGLAAHVNSGRLWAELAERPTGEWMIGFLRRAHDHARQAQLPPDIYVVSREISRENPRLAAAIEALGAELRLGTQKFKCQQKVSRHFEDLLDNLMYSHSLLATIDGLRRCLPAIVSAWNDDRLPMGHIDSTRYSASHKAIVAILGEDPVEMAREKFQQATVTCTNLREIQAAAPAIHHYDGSYGGRYTYSGRTIGFDVDGQTVALPMFLPDPRNCRGAFGSAGRRFADGLHPGDVIFPKAAVPVALRSAYSPNEKRLHHGVSLKNIIDAMHARKVATGISAGFIRWCLQIYIHQAGDVFFDRPARNPCPGKWVRSELLRAGFFLASVGFRRIRDRHFWQADVFWTCDPGAEIKVRRLLIESDGRSRLYTNRCIGTSEDFSDLLGSIFSNYRAPEPLTVEAKTELVAELRSKTGKSV